MHALEHILLITSVAVEADEISKAELVRTLKALAAASHSYVSDETPEIREMSEVWFYRYGHLMHPSLG